MKNLPIGEAKRLAGERLESYLVELRGVFSRVAHLRENYPTEPEENMRVMLEGARNHYNTIRERMQKFGLWDRNLDDQFKRVLETGKYSPELIR